MTVAPGPAARTVRQLGAAGLVLPRWVWGLVAVGWASWIWQLSAWEGPKTPGTFLWGWIGNTAHAPLYGLLALWLAFALPRREGVTPRGWADLGRGGVAFILACVAVYGAVDEWHQSWVAGRTVSLIDWLTDMVGASVVLWVAHGAAAAPGGVGRRLGLGAVACLAVSLLATLLAGIV